MHNSTLLFNKAKPSIIVQDNFYTDPAAIVARANSHEFFEDLRYFKGTRTNPDLLPWVKEYFEDLLHATIVDWMDQPYNGVFQRTGPGDPIVYHSDSQMYAAAIYLTKDENDFAMGTSFWRNKQYLIRSADEVTSPSVNAAIYNNYNFLHEDNWELVDRVGGIYNRLVIWDARLTHSATSYKSERLIHLHFFNIKK